MGDIRRNSYVSLSRYCAAPGLAFDLFGLFFRFLWSIFVCLASQERPKCP